MLLSCHYDIIDWLEPDWVFDIATGKFQGRGLWRRPDIPLEIYRTNWSLWKMFEPHHYLKAGPMVASFPYVGCIENKPVAHVAFSTLPGFKEARCARFVVLPEYQGCGVGLRFLEAVCDMWLKGNNPYDKAMRTTINTSHPGLCLSFRKSGKWRQYNGSLFGTNKAEASKAICKLKRKRGEKKGEGVSSSGYGGHFRATQGFRYYGDAGVLK